MFGRSKKPARQFVRCTTAVARDAVRREMRDNEEYIIVSSKTLPDDVVMNGLLYPANEIEAGFATLERTLAPLEHPTDKDGRFMSATDPDAIRAGGFHIGAHNENVRREGGFVLIDKAIHVKTAESSDKGKRLLDRINEIETNADARPIHTSVGVYIDVQPLKEMAINEAGDQYTGIARNMFFDHDAILLDNVGAAQPHQGVGLAVNQDGDEVASMETLVTIADTEITEMSAREVERAIFDSLNTPPLSADYIRDVYPSRVVYSLNDRLFTVPYNVGNGAVSIAGIPTPVEEETRYMPQTNEQGETMKLLAEKLQANGVNTDGMDDAAMLAAYDSFMANQAKSDTGARDDKGSEQLASVVTNAMKTLTERLEGLELKLNAQGASEHDAAAELIANSGRYDGLTIDDIKAMPRDAVSRMAALCRTSYGLPLSANSSDQPKAFSVPDVQV